MVDKKSVEIYPKGKKSGAWIIKGVTPPPATNGIEAFSAKDPKEKPGEK